MAALVMVALTVGVVAKVEGTDSVEGAPVLEPKVIQSDQAVLGVECFLKVGAMLAPIPSLLLDATRECLVVACSTVGVVQRYLCDKQPPQ